MAPVLDVRLRQRLGEFLLDVGFEAPAGVTALLGRSGSGKTSIVQAIAGLSHPDTGRVAVAGSVLLDTALGLSIPRHRRRMGYVFQEGRLFPHLTVRGNLAFGGWFAPRGTRADFHRVVEMLGIGDLLDRRPSLLSGGEKQRVAIGRALLSAPRLLLMDEPLAALDAARKAEILPYLERLRDETRLPILYVSHSVAEIARLANTVVAIEAGRILCAGPASAVLAAPELEPIIGRAEIGVILAARVLGHDAGDGLTELGIEGGSLVVPKVAVAPGSALRVRIRARDVMIATRRPEGLSALNVLPVTVVGLESGPGGDVEVVLRLGTAVLRARVTARSCRQLGLGPGVACFAVLKSVAVAARDLDPAVDPGP